MSSQIMKLTSIIQLHLANAISKDRKASEFTRFSCII